MNPSSHAIQDGTKCGDEGTCINGSCVVVKGSAKKTAEEKKVIELVRGVIEKDIEELLEAHEKYVLYQRKLGVDGYTDNTLASQFAKYDFPFFLCSLLLNYPYFSLGIKCCLFDFLLNLD